jgi:dihydroorotate dehydrogenase
MSWCFVWNIVKQLLFLLDAERAHDLAIQSLKLSKKCWSSSAIYEIFPRTLWGVYFVNPLGLAAGFDKNGQCLLAWQCLGFGSVEVGTVTALAQTGNPKPRLFRLPESNALLNRLGFNNVGAAEVAKNLEKQRRDIRLKIPIGVNIGKSQATSIKDAAKDYRHSFTVLADLADYVVINVSSPNTPGLRYLQEKKALQDLLEVISSENQRRYQPKPLLLKLAPDLHHDAAMQCAEIAVEFFLNGLVISNTTVARDNLRGKIPEGLGGISGVPLFEKSTQMLSHLHQTYASKLNFIGVGGITDKKSALSKLKNGADLLQAYTGFIYAGPFFVKNILSSLDKS